MAEEMEGEWVMGWPDRKRARIMPSKDAEGRTIYARSPVLDLEGVLTPTDAYYIVAQLDMPDPVHPDDFSFSIGGMVDSPTEYTLEDIRKLPGRTVRAVTECAGNDGEFFDYIKPGSNMKKPSLRVRPGGGRRLAPDHGFGRDPGHRGPPAVDPQPRAWSAAASGPGCSSGPCWTAPVSRRARSPWRCTAGTKVSPTR